MGGNSRFKLSIQHSHNRSKMTKQEHLNIIITDLYKQQAQYKKLLLNLPPTYKV